MDTTIYYGGCWSTNIGNAFIDYGAMHLCKEYNPYIFSELDYLFFADQRQNYLNTLADLSPKCVVFSGMVTCRQFIIDQKEIFELLDRLGVPIVLNGVGGETYTADEVRIFRDFIRKHNFIGFISRDDETYGSYHDLFPISAAGLDCGFFLSETDRFRMLKDKPKKYTVINNDDRGFNQSYEDFEEYKAAEEEEHLIVRSHHQLTKLPRKYIEQPRTLLSEMPDQYIYLYGQAKVTFATRVHACVATLGFGGRAVLLYDTPRSVMFRTVGCGDITQKPCSIDMELFEKRKQIHRQTLKQIMQQIWK